MKALTILGIETSCDETAAAVVMGGYDVVSSVVSTSIEQHVPFGGVVPEIASRAHAELIVPVVRRAISEAGIEPDRIDAVAAQRIPLPRRLVPSALEALGREDCPDLPDDAIELPLPKGVRAAYVRGDSLVLLGTVR